MFGDYESAKPEHRGRTEQRSATDLSTQCTALLLSTGPQTDNERCANTRRERLSVILSLKYLYINHLPRKNVLTTDAANHLLTPLSPVGHETSHCVHSTAPAVLQSQQYLITMNHE